MSEQWISVGCLISPQRENTGEELGSRSIESFSLAWRNNFQELEYVIGKGHLMIRTRALTCTSAARCTMPWTFYTTHSSTYSKPWHKPNATEMEGAKSFISKQPKCRWQQATTSMCPSTCLALNFLGNSTRRISARFYTFNKFLCWCTACNRRTNNRLNHQRKRIYSGSAICQPSSSLSKCLRQSERSLGYVVRLKHYNHRRFFFVGLRHNMSRLSQGRTLSTFGYVLNMSLSWKTWLSVFLKALLKPKQWDYPPAVISTF